MERNVLLECHLCQPSILASRPFISIGSDNAIDQTLADFTQVDTAFGLRLDYNDNGTIHSIVIAGLDTGDITSADFV